MYKYSLIDIHYNIFMFNILLILYILLDVGYSGTINPLFFFQAFSTTNSMEVTTLKLNTEYLFKFEFTLPSDHNPSPDKFKIEVKGFKSMRGHSYSQHFTNPSDDGK